MKIKEWNIESVTGYKPISTFYTDCSIAEGFGTAEIKKNYKEIFDGWKSNYKMMTEFVMVLNWKSMEHREEGNEELSALYSKLYYDAYKWCCDNLEGAAFEYYVRIIG